MNFYTEREIEFLQQNYLELTNGDLARRLGRSKSSIVNKLNKLNLRRPEGTFQRRAVEHQFKKGATAWNKGLTGIHFSPETEFKPGNLPFKTKHDGAITIRLHLRTGRYYKFIRIAQGKWVTYHSWLWEQEYGKIPKGYIVRFKDNCDTLDVCLENLILVHRKKHVRLNSNYEKGSRTLKQYWDNGGKGHLSSDKYIAFTLASHDDDLRKEIVNQPELVELKRMELKLKRAINNECNSKT